MVWIRASVMSSFLDPAGSASRRVISFGIEDVTDLFTQCSAVINFVCPWKFTSEKLQKLCEIRISRNISRCTFICTNALVSGWAWTHDESVASVASATHQRDFLRFMAQSYCGVVVSLIGSVRTSPGCTSLGGSSQARCSGGEGRGGVGAGTAVGVGRGTWAQAVSTFSLVRNQVTASLGKVKFILTRNFIKAPIVQSYGEFGLDLFISS